MSYRDDLAAAIARIQSLEQQLDGNRVGADQKALLDRIKYLEGQLAYLAGELARAKDERDELSAKLYGPKRVKAATAMDSLVAHNRRSGMKITGEAAGVVCPTCLGLGDRVEMVRGANEPVQLREGLTPVICPLCATTGLCRRDG